MTTKQEILNAAIANRAQYLLSSGAANNGKIFDGEALKWVYTGTPVLNTVFQMQGSSREEARGQIGEVLAKFRELEAVPTWLVSSTVNVKEMTKALESFSYEKTFAFHGMALDLDALQEVEEHPDFHMEAVHDREGLSLWATVCCEGFHIEGEWIAPFHHVMVQSGACSRYGYRHYLGYWQGQPAATVVLLPGKDGVIGVYWVATVPGARRKGVGAALMRQALREAKALGYRHATLQSTDMGHDFYKSLGFTDLYTEYGFEWRP